MQVDALHRSIADDVRVMHTTVRRTLPAGMPARAGHAMNLKAFVRRLNVVMEPLRVFNEMKTDAEVDPGSVRTTGLWVPKHELPENGSAADIRIIWHMKTKRVQMTQPEWTRRRYFFWQTYMHELVHRYQNQRNIRVYRPQTSSRDGRAEQTYYCNYDEIEAYAHDAALELLTWWGHLPFREATTEALMYHGRVVTPTYLLYDATFGDTPDHPALKQFKRKLRLWYDVVKASEIYQLIQLPNLVM
jgi:hypothetical protein